MAVLSIWLSTSFEVMIGMRKGDFVVWSTDMWRLISERGRALLAALCWAESATIAVCVWCGIDCA